MDNTKKFSGLAANYTVGRPAYAEEFIDSLYLQYGLSKQSIIADIGAGTGKLSKQLLERGSTVYCIEPNDDMRNTAIKELGMYNGFYAVNGTAADTKMADKSVDFITTAQAFHWFEPHSFKKECRRIMREKGLVFLIWNMRDLSRDVNRESFDIFSKYCPNFKGFCGGMQPDDERIKEFFDDQYDYIEFDNPVIYDKNKFISRSLSGSYTLKNGDAAYDNFIEALSKLFEQYAENDTLTIAYRTVAYIGKMN